MSDSGWTSNSANYIKPVVSDPWAAEAAAAGHRGTQHLTAVTTAQATPEVAAALDLLEGDEVAVRRRTVLLDDRPVELVDSYYPLAIAAGTGLTEPTKIRGGAVTLLGDLGYTAAAVDEWVSARLATAEERGALALFEGEWVLVQRRRSVAAGGTPFEYAVMTMVARGRSLHYQMKTA